MVIFFLVLLKIEIISMDNFKNKIFTDKDKKRYQSHQKGFYPSETIYKPKEKITSYKKSIFCTHNY